ncbi:MAG TPA: chemotaxis protein CheD [Bryobacteraceae bacterium]
MKAITVGIADCQVSKDADASLVTHALGSCMAVVIHDSQARVGGMLHLMLPESSIDPNKAQKQPFMFADTGVPELFHMAYALGAEKRRISVRLIGGAQVMDPNGIFNIGKRNHLACRKLLWKAGVMVHGEVVGGTVSRTVRLMVHSGQLLWSTAAGQLQELQAGAGKA